MIGSWHYTKNDQVPESHVARVLHLIWDQRGMLIARTCLAPGSEENARLMAAAPDMEAALIAADEHLGGDYVPDDTVALRAQIKIALAKARGETPLGWSSVQS